MAALIIAALFWGNCFSCPQLLVAQQHQCCHHEKAPTAACQLQNLQHFVKVHAPSPAAPPVVSGPSAVIGPVFASVLPASSIASTDPIAPDLFSLRI
jgi:hypothetical protein